MASRPLPSVIRFYAYGLQGLLDEILFTAIFDVVFHTSGNPQLKGYTSLFSFIMYGSCSFFVERLYAYLYLKRGMKWYSRFPLYLIVFYTWEFCFGLVLRQFDACSWDYSHYPLNFMGLITLIYAPFWFVLCVLQDYLADFLLSLRITISSDNDSVQIKKLYHNDKQA